MGKVKKTPSAKSSTRTGKAPTHAKKAAAVSGSKAQSESDALLAMDRRASNGRRKAEDRRKADVPVVVERRQLERRQKVIRRRQIDPTTCERNYSVDEIAFMSALEGYKRTSGRMFPTCSEILEVLRNLGYEKLAKVEPAVPCPVLEPCDPTAASLPSTVDPVR